MMWICKYIIVLCLCFLPISHTYAFKIDTHVWLSQQVLNDVLDDGRITIAPYGSFKVNSRLVNALRDNPNEFRMGSIGPDGFPDLVGGQQTVHPGVPGGWKTDDWLKWMLDNANTDRRLAFAYGYLNHAAADIFAHTYVNIYAGDMFNLLDGQEVELRHMALEEFIKNHTPPVRDNNNKILKPHQIVTAPAAFLRDTLVLNSAVANQYRKQPGTIYLALMHEQWNAIGTIISEIDDIKADADSIVDSIQKKIDGLQDEINSLKDVKVDAGLFKVKLYPAYCFIDPATCLLIQSLTWTLEATEQSLGIPRRIKNLAISALQEPLRAWRGEIEEAIKEYMITSQNVAIELMKTNGDPLAQIGTWVCEWAPVFAGVPNEASWPACATSRAVNRIKSIHTDITNGINEFRGYVADKLGVMSWVVDPAYQIELLVDEHVKQPYKDLALIITESLLSKATGENSLSLDILTFRTEKQTESKLNIIFNGDSSGKGLLNFTNVARRVKSEMYLDAASGYFDPNRYNLVHNAIVLSKLVMLDASQLNLLVKRAGIAQTIYGPDLYDPETFSNILIGSIASIDGDHQWQEYAPDYPRRANPPDDGVADENYGYAFTSSVSNKNGFRLWQDCEVRNLVFKEIFSGPVAPGLEVPSMFNLDPITDYGNPTGVSEDNPFPLSDRSSLALKALTDDPIFSTTDWMATGNLTKYLDYTRYSLPSTALLTVNLPISKYLYKQQLINSADRLVKTLSAQACGGGSDKGFSATWGFKNDCTYQCYCKNYSWFDPAIRRPVTRTSCNCSSPECGVLPVINNPQQMIELGMAPASASDCGLCHTSDFSLGLTAGFYFAKTKYVPGVKVGKGIEYDGTLICDANAIQTKLIMKAVDQKDINVIVTDSATGERAISASTKTTNYPELVNVYSDWRDVNAAILTSTNNQSDACGFPLIVDEQSFEMDTRPPALTVPDDISMSCVELNDSIAMGNSVQDIVGLATVIDNRDPDVQLSNDAPTRLALGSTLIDWIAVDDANNSVSATQRVLVTDVDSPVFSATPTPLTVIATNPLGTLVSVNPPVAKDECEGNIVATTSTNLAVMPVGESTVNWSVQDSSGNSTNVSQQIIVKMLAGDMNVDGVVNPDDLILLENAVGNVVISETTVRDYDQDGDIDEADRATFDLIKRGDHDPYDLNNDLSINEMDARQLIGMISGPIISDVDKDGINDSTDNCIIYSNPDQVDTDGDGIGDICDLDQDSDGLMDDAEINTYKTDPTDADTDNDGLNDGYEVREGLNPLDSTDCPNWICSDSNRRGWRLGIGL